MPRRKDSHNGARTQSSRYGLESWLARLISKIRSNAYSADRNTGNRPSTCTAGLTSKRRPTVREVLPRSYSIVIYPSQLWYPMLSEIVLHRGGRGEVITTSSICTGFHFRLLNLLIEMYRIANAQDIVPGSSSVAWGGSRDF